MSCGTTQRGGDIRGRSEARDGCIGRIDDAVLVALLGSGCGAGDEHWIPRVGEDAYVHKVLVEQGVRRRRWLERNGQFGQFARVHVFENVVPVVVVERGDGISQKGLKPGCLGRGEARRGRCRLSCLDEERHDLVASAGSAFQR